MMWPAIVALLAATDSAAASAASAHASHSHGPAVAVASTAIGPDGTTWVARVDGGHVVVASSKDDGGTFTTPVRVNPAAEKIDGNGEARPKIAVGAPGQLFVTYTRRLEKPYTGEVLFSRSADGGQTFSPPMSLMEGLSSGRFDTLAVSPKGVVHVFFIGRAETKDAGLYQAVSGDEGRTFTPARKIKGSVCECCRLAVAWDGEIPVVLWRDILDGGIRDHSLARIEPSRDAAVVRATEDGWEIAACPHHGPAFVIDGAGVHHLAWFTGDGRDGKGTFYRRSSDGGASFSDPVRLGGDTAGRPQLLAAGTSVWLTWKEARADGATAVMMQRSSDSGATWTDAAEIARTSGGSDHPLLVAHQDRAVLSWVTADEGYRLIPLRAPPGR